MPSKSELRNQWDSAPENKVILHMLGRAKTRPNVSPFCVKLETYLRVAGIEYEADFTQPMGVKGKSPWVTFNKKDYSDSQMIIDMLGKELDKNLTAKVANTAEQRASARALRIMIEEHLNWCVTIINVGKLKGKYFRSIMPPLPVPGFLQGFAFNQLSKRLLGQAYASGLGRHSYEEVEQLGNDDLKALSEYLGDKSFFLGDQPTELDCVAFAFLSVILAGDAEDENPFKKTVEEEMPNLKALFERVKEKYFEDWEELQFKEKEKTEKKKEEEKEEEKKEEENGEKKEDEGEARKEEDEK